jgi:hypothetical protein
MSDVITGKVLARGWVCKPKLKTPSVSRYVDHTEEECRKWHSGWVGDIIPVAIVADGESAPDLEVKHEWSENDRGEAVLRMGDIPNCDVVEWRIQRHADTLWLHQVDECADYASMGKLPNTLANIERLKRLAERIKEVLVEFRAEGGAK